MSRVRLPILALVSAALSFGCDLRSGLGDLVGDVPDQPPSAISPSWRKLSPSECAPAPWEEDVGHFVYRLASSGEAFRMAAQEGAEPENISTALDRFSPGMDLFVSTARSGNWLLVRTTRFGCKDECLAVVSRDLCRVQVVFAGGEPAPGATGAISSDGNLIVYSDGGGPHRRDLWAIRRNGELFSAPVLLTKKSTAKWNEQPALSEDGTKVLFDCGDEAGSGPGTSICEVSTKGEGLRVIVEGGESANHHAGYAPDGSIVLEATWAGAEQVWRATPPSDADGEDQCSLIHQEKDEDGTAVFTDDNSPCPLPDGRILSLWMGRRGSGDEGRASGHEPLLTDADGKTSRVILPGVDIADIGLSCSW